MERRQSFQDEATERSADSPAGSGKKGARTRRSTLNLSLRRGAAGDARIRGVPSQPPDAPAHPSAGQRPVQHG
jgi:hypothetical protein